MIISEIILVVLIISLTIQGFKDGFVMGLLSLLSLIMAMQIAVLYAHKLAESIQQYLAFVDILTLEMITLISIFLLAASLFGLIIHLFKLVNYIPLIGTLNKFLGLITGFLKGLIFSSLLILLFEQIAGDKWLNLVDKQSFIYSNCKPIAPLIYDTLNTLLPFGNHFYEQFDSTIRQGIEQSI